MEMDSSRRPFDRSRELNLKKPRLNEDPTMTNPNPRSFAASRAGLNPVPPRYRLRESDTSSTDSTRGGSASEAYQPQPVAAHQQQHQELIERYKSALSELTFNSKPIITNLTIIAGESLHAAKGIAATICTNIIEVPSDQKLPSLYLLDSIVKNIGRDYIKYFAARLPEVFSKAYRQVDPSIHSSMRHLFGTWKGVFHPQTLQTIEKELGFGSAANGSTGPTSRSDAQSPRPGHSIHVNPKYLERQRLQHSGRAKADDMTETLATSTEDAERLDRGSSITPRGQWMDPQRSRRDPVLEPEAVQDEDISVYRDHGYGSDVSRNTALAAGRNSGRIIEQGHLKPWYGAGSNVSEPLSSQRNGFSVKHGLPSFPPPKSINVDVHRKPTSSIARSGGGISSSSWKNSEEEEFMWDSLDSRANDDSSNISSVSHRDPWTLGGSERLELENNLPKALLNDAQLDAGPSANYGPSEGYRTGISGLSTSTTSLSRAGIGSQVRSSYAGASGYGIPGTASLGSPGTAGQRRAQSLRSSSPSGQSFVGQCSPSPSDKANVHQQVPVEQDYPQIQTGARTGLRTPQFSGRLSAGPTDQYAKEPSVHAEKKFPLGELKSSSTFPSQTIQHPSISHQLQSDAASKGFGRTKKPLPPQVSGREATSAGESLATERSISIAVMTSGQPKTAGLVAAVNSVSSGVKSFSGGKPIQPQMSIQPPLPTGPPPVQSASSQLKAASLPLSSSSHEIMSISVDVSQAKMEPIAALVSTAAEQSSTEKGKTPDPISNLLTSLVAKGLISASNAELPTSMSLQIPKESPKQGQSSPEKGSGPLSSAAESVAVPIVSEVDEVSNSGPDSKMLVTSPPLVTEEIKNLIGFEIRPDVIREFHSSVISDLFDDFPHQCSICGLQLRLKERLDRHMEWHSSKESGSNGVKSASRGWYANLSDWIAGETRLSFGFKSEGLDKKLDDRMQTDEPMVPVDETQCACLLCGQLFDDVYDVKRDEWMFRGAVYMTVPPTEGNSFAKSEIAHQGLIVHSHCLTESSLQDLGLCYNIKLEKDS